MNRLLPGLLALLALALGAPVAAAWVPFLRSDASVVYVDAASFRKEGHVRRALVLVDMHDADPNGARSRRGHSEIDCQGDRMRIHDLSGFSGNMGSGQAVYAFTGATDWVPIPRGTTLWDTIRRVCSR